MALFICLLLFVAFCAAVIVAPQAAIQAGLAIVWGAMALAAIVSPLLSYFRVI